MGIPDDPCADGILVASDRHEHKDQDFAASTYVVLQLHFRVSFKFQEDRPIRPVILHPTKTITYEACTLIKNPSVARVA